MKTSKVSFNERYDYISRKNIDNLFHTSCQEETSVGVPESNYLCGFRACFLCNRKKISLQNWMNVLLLTKRMKKVCAY